MQVPVYDLAAKEVGRPGAGRIRVGYRAEHRRSCTRHFCASTRMLALAPATPMTRGRSARRWPQAVAAEGHRPRAPGFDPLATVERRWRGLRSAPTLVRPGDAEEDAPAGDPLGPVGQGHRRAIVVVEGLERYRAEDQDDDRLPVATAGVQRSTLIVVGAEGDYEAVYRAAGNLEDVKIIRAGYVNVRDVLNYERLLLTTEAVDSIHGLWAQKLRRRAHGKPARVRCAPAAADH